MSHVPQYLSLTRRQAFNSLSLAPHQGVEKVHKSKNILLHWLVVSSPCVVEKTNCKHIAHVNMYFCILTLLWI